MRRSGRARLAQTRWAVEPGRVPTDGERPAPSGISSRASRDERFSMRAAILILSFGVSAGCYNYNPLTTPTPQAGSYVAVTLTDSGSQELARYLGPNVFVVGGRYRGDSDHGLLLSVASVELKRGNELSWEGETVALPNGAIASLDGRRLAKGRSTLLGSVGAGGLVATTLAFTLNGGGTALGPGRRRPNPQ